MATKVINSYRGYTASTIKNRATCPNSGDMTEVSSTIECQDISTTKIRNAISANTNSIGSLCNHANVNRWSGFGPIKRTEVNGDLVNGNPTDGYRLGDFAGYNHYAPQPSFSNNVHLNNVNVDSGGTATLTADIVIGEAKYIAGDISNHYDCVGIALTVWDGANLVGFGIEDLGSLQNYASLSAYVHDCVLSKTYTCKIYLTNSLTVFNQNGENAVCQLSQLANYQTPVTVRAATSLSVQADGFTVSGAGFNLSAGSCGFTDAYLSIDYPALEIVARLMDPDSNIVNSIVWFSDAYTANTHLGSMSEVLNGGNPVPAYGYTFQILFYAPY